MSLLVPLYVHPAEDPGAWHRLITRAAHTYAVVLNPANGPGRAPDPAFVKAADALRAAGARLLGYLDTDYGAREHAEITADLRRHQEWYAVDGCFLDQVPAAPDALPDCRRLVRSARRLGASTVVLNPGVHLGYVDGQADAVGGGAVEAEPGVVRRVPEDDDVVLALLLGRREGGADDRGAGAAALPLGPHGARGQAQGRDVADVAAGQQGVTDGAAVVVRGDEGQALDPGGVGAQGVDEVGFRRGLERGEVDVADGRDVGAGLSARDPVAHDG